ncbi:MAG: proteasome assembly chaperone family protein [Hadesarchaea archaeon]|nr:proteasome assembly chaperone family protein [Hadesarchaea archaeon]
MSETRIEYINKPDLKNPILIEGLPGMGYVGKLAAEHLIEELDAEKFAELSSDYFPHHVLVDTNGVLKSVKNEFYHTKLGDRDTIIVVGDVQATTSQGHYQITEEILNLAEEFEVNRMFTLGGYATGEYTKKKPKVIGIVNQSELKNNFNGIEISHEEDRGPIIGVSGLLLGMGKLRGIEGLCILGETHGMLVDPRSAQSVLETLSDLLEFEVDTTTLAERAKKTEELIKKVKKEEKVRRERMDREGEELTYIG